MPKKRHEEASRWYHQACYDLKAVAWNIEGGFYDTACFLAQQASEKALKSLLYALGARRKVLLTHSVFEMVRAAMAKAETLGAVLEQARELDLHYILHPCPLPEWAAQRLSSPYVFARTSGTSPASCRNNYESRSSLFRDAGDSGGA